MPTRDLSSIAADLAKAPATSDTRSETAQLADLIEQIDTAIARGVPRIEILALLHKGGFSMSLQVFDNALHRIRKRTGRVAPRRTPSKQTRPVSASIRKASGVVDTAVSRVIDGPADRIKTLDELARENPNLSHMELIKLEARQYDRDRLSGARLDELARKYGNAPKD
jgi:hypothetical protein